MPSRLRAKKKSTWANAHFIKVTYGEKYHTCLEGTLYVKTSNLEGFFTDNSGLVWIGTDGQPVALFWGFVNDFMLHAPTWTKCILALNALMDLTLWLGIMCQKVKLKLPSQVQKYTGVLFDTTGVPTLLIPPDNVNRAWLWFIFSRQEGLPWNSLICPWPWSLGCSHPWSMLHPIGLGRPSFAVYMIAYMHLTLTQDTNLTESTYTTHACSWLPRNGLTWFGGNRPYDWTSACRHTAPTKVA